MNIQAITFDYFGTLVDVDQGGIAGMRAVLAEAGLRSGKALADIYLDWDIRNVRLYRGGKYRSYRSVARDALAATLEALQPGCSADLDVEGLTELYLGHLVESAPPHPEVPPILDWLGSRFPMMPITNMDSELGRHRRCQAPGHARGLGEPRRRHAGHLAAAARFRDARPRRRARPLRLTPSFTQPTRR
jgi:2-haloacid dehalogenase